MPILSSQVSDYRDLSPGFGVGRVQGTQSRNRTTLGSMRNPDKMVTFGRSRPKPITLPEFPGLPVNPMTSTLDDQRAYTLALRRASTILTGGFGGETRNILGALGTLG
jgi:hypothetical protein